MALPGTTSHAVLQTLLSVRQHAHDHTWLQSSVSPQLMPQVKLPLIAISTATLDCFKAYNGSGFVA